MTRSRAAYSYKLILFRFLARRTDAKFNKIILRRLFMSKYVPLCQCYQFFTHLS